MSTFIKSALLGLSLAAGAALSAYAQTDNVAALPPTGGVSAPAAVGPSVAYPVAAAPKYVGPNPGKAWGTPEKQTLAVQPSPTYLGPPLSGDRGDE